LGFNFFDGQNACAGLFHPFVQIRDALSMLLELTLEIASEQVPLGVRPVDTDRFVAVLEGSPVVALRPQHLGALDQEATVIGRFFDVQPERLIDRGDGLGGFPVQELDSRQLPQGVQSAWVQSNGLLQITLSLGKSAENPILNGPLEVSLEVTPPGIDQGSELLNLVLRSFVSEE
jgi:hypothetical protein